MYEDLLDTDLGQYGQEHSSATLEEETANRALTEVYNWLTINKLTFSGSHVGGIYIHTYINIYYCHFLNEIKIIYICSI